MSLENAINRLTQVIKAVKGPKKTRNFGPISVDGNNCTCTERAGQSNICVSADCGDTFCRLMDDGWQCKAKFKLPEINMAAKAPTIFTSEPSRVPGWRRLGDCPVDRFGQLDWKKLPQGVCCFASTPQGCLSTCGGEGPGFKLVSEGPCPQDGLFTPDDLETGQG